MAFRSGFGFTGGGAFPLSSAPSYVQFGTMRNVDFGGIAGDITERGCETLGIPRSICELGGAAVNAWLGGGVGGGSSAAAPLVADCPEGYRVDPDTGRCIEVGFRGGVERFLPGGQSGTLEDIYGDPVVGAFGQAGIVPAQRGVIQKNDGSQAPILRCPSGMVLAKDNICYAKSVIPRRFRKWPPGPKPPISGSDAKAIRKADSAKSRVKKLAMKSGFSCKRK